MLNTYLRGWKIRLTITVLLFTLGTVYLIYLMHYKVKEECIEKHFLILDNSAQYADTYLKYLGKLLVTSLNPLEPLVVDRRAATRLDRLSFDNPEFGAVWLSNNKGDIIFSTNTAMEGINISSHTYFKQMAVSRKPVLSDLHESKVSGNRVLTICMPVFSNGSLIGAISARLKPERLNESFRAMVSSRSNASVSIVDENGIVIVATDANQLGKSYAISEAFKAGLAGNRGVLDAEVTPSSSQPHVIVYRPLGDFQGAILLSQPRGDVYAPLFKLLLYEIPKFLLWGLLLLFLLYDKSKSEKRRERETIDMQAEKSIAIAEVAASMAHEVRNPLTSVRGFMQLLANRTNDLKAIEYGKLIVEEVDRVESIISEFLNVAKSQSSKKEYCNLASILRSVYLLAEGRGIFTNVEVSLTEADTTIEILADCNALKQVFLNLCTNAIQAMPQGGHVTIALKRQGEKAVVTISDTGIGISKENIQRLGERFFTTKEGGSGLGLAVVYRIVENHRGQIFVDSELGSGTTFTVVLPLKV